jgi:hypothetical protein
LTEENNQVPTPQAPLTIDSPVGKDVVDKLEEMERARLVLSDRNMQIDVEKLRILNAVQGIEREHRKIYEKILLDRGLDPTLRVTVDETGKIELADPT